MKKMNEKIAAGVAVALAAASPAFAVTDYSSLTSAVDFTAVGTALLAIGALLMAPKVVKWGVSKVLSMIRGG